MYRLVFLSGPLKGKRLVVQQDAVVIGRDPDCSIVVPDDEISRKHVAIERTAEGVRIRDLGSMNGILLNDRQLREAFLQHGDTFEIGRTRAQFQMTGHSEATHARRISRVQGLTLAAVVVIILFELTFLVGLSFWHGDVLTTPPRVSPGALPAAAGAETQMETAVAAAAPPGSPAMAGVTTAAPVEAEAHVVREIERLREDMEGLRDQVHELAKPPPVLVAFEPVESATADKPEAPPKPAADPLAKRAQEMLDEAILEITRNNFNQADQLLERIEFMAPDFLPAYLERARLLERLGMLAKAGEQWTEVMNRSKGKPLYEQAAAERIRVSRLEMVRKTTAVRGPGQPAEAASRLPRRVRIVSIGEQRFQASDQFDEMRLVGVALRQKPGEKELDSYDVRVVIKFFDQESETNGVALTRAIVPKEPLRVEGYWSGRDERAVSAAYVVPPGFREQEKQKYGRRRYYSGCLVQVYYRDQLQDEDARPRNLIEKAARMPQPMHGTKPAKEKKPAPPAEPAPATDTVGAASAEAQPPAPSPSTEQVPSGMR